LGGGAGSSSNTMCRPGPMPNSIVGHTKWHLDSCSRFDTIDISRKLGGCVVPLFGGGAAGSPSKTMRPGLRPTSVPSNILIQPAIWPQQTLAKNWGLCPFGEGELGPHLSQCGGAEAYLCAKFYLDPLNRLATIHQRYRQTDRTDKWPIA